MSKLSRIISEAEYIKRIHPRLSTKSAIEVSEKVERRLVPSCISEKSRREELNYESEWKNRILG